MLTLHTKAGCRSFSASSRMIDQALAGQIELARTKGEAITEVAAT